jgi:hypothetical protein
LNRAASREKILTTYKTTKKNSLAFGKASIGNTSERLQSLPRRHPLDPAWRVVGFRVLKNTGSLATAASAERTFLKRFP